MKIKCLQEKFNRQNSKLQTYCSQMSGSVLKQLIQSDFKQRKRDFAVLDYPSAKIVKIGPVPIQISLQVKVLNLSNNNLKTLQGIEQFLSLETLNLVNNKITVGSELLILKQLTNLQKVFLKGNPFLDRPLDQEILSFLGSFQNDLYILNYAFCDSGRQSLINSYKKGKSPNRNKNLAQSSSPQSLKHFSQLVGASQSVQKSKVNMLLSNMEQFIEERRQSQQISSQQIDNVNNLKYFGSSQIQVKNLQGKNTGPQTPLKRSPNFGQSSRDNKNQAQANQSLKRHEQSTQLKTKNRFTTSIKQQSQFCQQNLQNQASNGDRLSWRRHHKTDRQKTFYASPEKQKSFGLSPQREFKYQVSNLKINMASDHPELNYPSIIQNQDPDSYEIEFDFMSPKKSVQQNKRSVLSRGSPQNQLQNTTAQYLRIQDDHISEKEDSTQAKPKRISQRILQKRILRQTLQKQNDIHKRFPKQTGERNPQQLILEPITIIPRKGSLYESIRTFVPQTSNNSNVYQLINKHFNMTLGDLHMHSFSQSPSQIIENMQKFDKFYYTSLTRLKPMFNLLYSPFSSLKVQEKDILLQELLKNHKQIFMLLIRQYHSREILEQDLNNKTIHVEELTVEVDNLEKIARDYTKRESSQRLLIQTLRGQAQNLKVELTQFEDAFQSRQKVIKDVQIQYQKATRNALKKQQLLQKYLNEDEIEQEIIQKRQKLLKQEYLQTLQKKASNSLKINLFHKKIQERQKNRQQSQIHDAKYQCFEALKTNYKKQKAIKVYTDLNNKNTLFLFFNEWKNEARMQKKSKRVSTNLNKNQKKDFFSLLGKLYLTKERSKKVTEIYELKLKRITFFKGFRKNFWISKDQSKEFSEKACIFNRRKVLRRYFQLFRSNIIQEHTQIQQRIKQIQTILIPKNTLILMRKIINFNKKECSYKYQKLQTQVIQPIQKLKFLTFLRHMRRKKIKSIENQKTALKYRLLRIFKSLKDVTKKEFLRYNKFQKKTRKIAHEERINRLIVVFKQNSLQQRLNKQKNLKLFRQLDFRKVLNQIFTCKRQELKKYLNFRRGFKAKHNFIMRIRFLNSKRRLQNRQKNIEEHFFIQQSKYKEGHQLNILTIEQLKSQINDYLTEIQFQKIQIQKLSQRQLFILQEKQDCLLEMKFKQEENEELRRAIVQNQRILEQLQRKYEKSLDMYASAMQITQRQMKMDHSSFLCDTIIKPGTRSPNPFRKQVTQTGYNSLKR